MKYRRRIFPAMAALLLALSLCPCSALAAGDGAAENMETATAPAQAEPPALYPTEVLEYTAGDLDEPRISKTYELSPTDDPAFIPTGDFERSGRVYTLLDITRGFLHARTKRRVVVCFMKRAAISGSSFFSAELSRRALVTGFQVTFQSVPERVSTPWASIWLLMLSWTASISAARSSAIRRSSRNSFTFALISVVLIVWAPFRLV